MGTIRPDTPAEKALQPGDRILSVDGQSFAGLGLENRLIHFGKLVASHECAGKQVDGCIAADAGRRSRSSATGGSGRSRCGPNTAPKTRKP